MAIWIVDKVPFTMKVDKQIEPTIYMDGSFVDMTTVTASLLMEEDMRNFAFLTTDGRAISTSRGRELRI